MDRGDKIQIIEEMLLIKVLLQKSCKIRQEIMDIARLIMREISQCLTNQ
jgi:hypothetical protein